MSPAQEITVRLDDGNEYSHKVVAPKGYPANPMSDEELAAKFMDCTRLFLPQKAIEQVLGMADKLESLDDCSELMKLLV